MQNSTKELLRLICQWVRDNPCYNEHGDELDDSDLENLCQIIKDPRCISEYDMEKSDSELEDVEDVGECKYMYQSGSKCGHYCGSKANSDNPLRCKYHNHPIFMYKWKDLQDEIKELLFGSKDFTTIKSETKSNEENTSLCTVEVVSIPTVHIKDNLYRMLKYDFLLQRDTTGDTKVFGVISDLEDMTQLRQLTSTEVQIAESFGLKVE